jgi:CRISPR/Cas system type I-B associated protein Csh2 (Cas7 group RAMP superfamily)
MSKVLNYPSFLRAAAGGYIQTNDVLVDRALRKRLADNERRRFDQIADRVAPETVRRLSARRPAAAGARCPLQGRPSV